MDKEFKTKGFKVVRNFYDFTSHSEKIPDLYHHLKNSKHLAEVDTQVPMAEAFYNNIELQKVHIRLLPKIEKEVGFSIYPTYCYARIYNKDSVLTPHTDRPACEISITLNIGLESEYSWPIWIKDFNGESHEVKLNPGDGLIYHGCDLEHWREPADPRVVNHIQTFLHFVKQDGQFENYIFDQPEKEISNLKKESKLKRILNIIFS